MTFPATPRAALYELQLDATDWANVSDDTFALRAPTSMTWGVPGEYSQADPSTLSFWLNNAGGKYSPRNPLSPVYGHIGRNTPVRHSIGEGAYGLVLAGVIDSFGYAYNFNAPATQITGDLDFRVDLELLTNPVSGVVSDWTTGNFDLASKFGNADISRSWTLIMVAGKLRFNWFPLGTVASARSATSTVVMPGPAQGRRAVRVTIDVDNGAGGVDVKFYTAPTIAGTWTQLGATITSAGTSSILGGADNLRIGSNLNASSYTWTEPPSATFYKAELRNGINGTLVASPDFTVQELDSAPFTVPVFTDANGLNWQFNGTSDAARIWYGDVDVRHHGESSSFPNRWDTSGNDAWVPIESAGILRRLGFGQQPASTGMRDWVMSQDPLPASYFPLSGDEATRYSVNIGRIGTNSFRFRPQVIDDPHVDPAIAYTYGQDMGPVLGDGMQINATGPNLDLQGDVAIASDNFTLDFVYQSPYNVVPGTLQNTNIGVLDLIVWSYDNDRFRLRLQNSSDTGTLQVTFFDGVDGSSSTFSATGALIALQDNNLHAVRFQVRSSGGSYFYEVWIDGVSVNTGTIAVARPWNGTSCYQIFYERYTGQTVVNVGHFTVWEGIPAYTDVPTVADYWEAAQGYIGELAADRIERIAGLGNFPVTIKGSNADTMAMGPQYSEAKLTQVRDAEQADMGYLTEPRNRFGLEYRTRVSMVGQAPALTLDYSAGHIVPPFDPTDDDQLTKNDVTVTRREGDSFRLTEMEGRLSVLEPPFGVGRYHDQVEVNVATDGQLPGIAGWLLNLGTVDQARYPAVTVDLGILAAAGLDKAARAVTTGDLLVITGMDELGVYEDVRLLVLGGAEVLSEGGYRHLISWNCAPYAGYEGSVFATSASVGTARYDSDGSIVSTAATTNVTSLFVASTTGVLWTTDSAARPFDIMVGGERMTVTNVISATSPQIFTVTRSVNGVVKAHPIGTEVRLADPAYFSL